MRTLTPFALILCALTAPSLAAPPTLHERTLENGLRFRYLHLEGSPHVSIFTFLPVGLAFDDRDRAQWSHLIEHLIIRTTVKGQLTTVNAETLPDHMRLDFYGDKDNWQQGLDHHVKWLSNLPFTDESVRAEPKNATREADFTAKNLATHKFAAAAWNQVCRHGKNHAAIKADLLNASRADLEACRDARLPRPGQTLICMIGGVDTDTILNSAAKRFSAIKAPATQPVGEVAAVKPGEHHATWDLDARHLLLCWRIPTLAEDVDSHAALATLARTLMIQVQQDAALQKLLGPALASADELRCPEATYFSISAPLRQGADFNDARDLLLKHVEHVGASRIANASHVAQMLAREIDVQDPAALQVAVPNIKPQMLEAQIALTWANADYRLGASRRAFQVALRDVTDTQIRKAASKYLTPKLCTTLELSPR